MGLDMGSQEAWGINGRSERVLNNFLSTTRRLPVQTRMLRNGYDRLWKHGWRKKFDH